MSLHAKLSPEALARLRAQKRNSIITSIIIAILIVFLICVILLYLLLPIIYNNSQELVAYQTATKDAEEVTKPEMTNNVERKPTAPSSSMAKIIAANTPSITAIPVPEIDAPNPSLDFGNGDDFGAG
jgi:predicted PurR-regulated permease PerM